MDHVYSEHFIICVGHCYTPGRCQLLGLFLELVSVESPLEGGSTCSTSD
jgi:hypothetical protein